MVTNAPEGYMEYVCSESHSRKYLDDSFVIGIDVVEVKLHGGCPVYYVRRPRRNDVVGFVDRMESSTSGFPQRIIGDWLVALV